MADTRVSIRVGVDGGAEVTGALDAVGKAGEQAFAQVAASAEKANSAVDRQAERYKRLAEAARASFAADQAQTRVNDLLGVRTTQPGSARASAAAFEEAAKEQASLAARTRALKDAIDPTAAAYRRMTAAVVDADQLLKTGAITQGEHAAAVGLAKRAFEEAEKAGLKFGASVGLNRLQILELAHVGRALFDQMAAGANPLRALALEGGRVSQIFAAGPGGVGGTLSAIPALLSELVSPTIAFGAASAAAAGAALVAWQAYDAGQRQIALSLKGAGAAAGATAAQINTIAEASADAGHVSVAAARAMEIEFARTGKIGVENFSSLVKFAKDFGATIGVDTEAAVKQLAEAMADPAKGADVLNQKLGFLDAATKAYITRLAEQGNRTAAQRALLDAMTGSLGRASDATNVFGRAWEEVSVRASNAFNKIGHFVDTFPTTLRALSVAAELTKRLATGSLAPTAEETASAERLRKEAEDAANRARQLAEAREASLRLQESVSQNLPELLARDKLTELEERTREDILRLEALRKLAPAENDDIAQRREQELVNARTLLDAVTKAQETYTDAIARTKAIEELDEKALTARTSAEKEAIARKREEIELAGKVVPLLEREALVDAAGAKARLEAERAVRERNRQAAEGIADQIAAQDKYNHSVESGKESAERAGKEIQREVALRQQLRAALLLDGPAREREVAAIRAQEAATEKLERAQIKLQALSKIADQQRSIDLAQKEIELVGKNAAETDVIIAELRAKNELLKAGIDLDIREGREIVANAGKLEELNQELRRRKAAQAEFEGLFDSLTGRISDFLLSGKKGWEQWRETALEALKDIEKEALKLAVINPLKNLLFGSNSPTGSDLANIFGFGGFGNLFGFGGGGEFVAPFHSGGVAGQGHATRFAPGAAFASAPRLHSGAFLRSDEVPAILQKGERVLSVAETNAYHRGVAGGRPQSVVNFNIATPDRRSFEASEGQITAILMRALARGARFA